MKEKSHPSDRRMAILIVLILFAMASGCAPAFLRSPLSDEALKKVITLLKSQEEKVDTFLTSGHLTVKDWYWDQEANVLTAGTRTPLRLRMEITHAWGQPMLHLLVIGRSFRALSYGERKLYTGDLVPGALSRFFPADLDEDLIWEVLRGFPKLREDGRVESRTVDAVSLLDPNGHDRVIVEFEAQSLLPRRSSFPERKIAVRYGDFDEEDGISGSVSPNEELGNCELGNCELGNCELGNCEFLNSSIPQFRFIRRCSTYASHTSWGPFEPARGLLVFVQWQA